MTVALTPAPAGASAARTPGLFISIDGPGGVGKSTVIEELVDRLAAAGFAVHRTTEPSTTPIGNLIRASTETYRGMALACLCAGDRHHHLTAEIDPHVAAGAVVVSDRYLPSSYVLQRLDGLNWDTITALNAGARPPDLAVILTADPQVIAARIAARGRHSRFERQPRAAADEAELYADTATRLTSAGWHVTVLDTTITPAHETAAALAQHIDTLDRSRGDHARRSNE